MSRMDETLWNIWEQSLYPNLYMHKFARPMPGLSSCVPGGMSYPFESNLMSSRTCRYCGNLYPRDIINDHRNFPTCAGGWSD